MVNKSNIGELTVEQKDFRLTIKQKEEQIVKAIANNNQSIDFATIAKMLNEKK